MLEYLDPCHWSLLDLIPHKDAQWHTQQHLAFDFRFKIRHSLKVVSTNLYLENKDECRHIITHTECAGLYDQIVLDLGKPRVVKYGEYQVPIRTVAGLLLFRYWVNEGYVIVDHPGPPSVFYDA
jgi:hypothetical protein